jgi:hypothetical protein
MLILADFILFCDAVFLYSFLHKSVLSAGEKFFPQMSLILADFMMLCDVASLYSFLCKSVQSNGDKFCPQIKRIFANIELAILTLYFISA